MNEFGKSMRRLRADRAQTQQELADELGVSRAFVHAVESGKSALPSRLVEWFPPEMHDLWEQDRVARKKARIMRSLEDLERESSGALRG